MTSIPERTASFMSSPAQAAKLTEVTTDVLLDTALSYGKIFLYQADDNTFSFNITFSTTVGTSLKAESGFNHKTINSAIIIAIENAEKILQQFKK